MNKLSLLLALLGCILISSVISETNFEFPAQACATSIATTIYTGCMAAMAESIWKIHQWGEDTAVPICGNPCIGNLKGRISKFQWKWDAKFHCTNKGQGIIGESSALSRDGAMKGALENWMTQASQAGKISVEDFKC
ncbi:unnamed protein product [Adineta steineri]|uniref:Uncharacterized protein n=1 Tax=Adineta steineri TaxID=433720 RepID=A0A818SN19_9BILA|nr:unnamed protein product [Adineta steineri]